MTTEIWLWLGSEIFLLDLEVKHTVENMVESLVFAGQPMDSLSIDDLGLEVHHVPGDGDCLVHSWVTVLATKINDDFPLVFRSVGCCREALARFFAEHRHLLELHHQKKRVWPWHRPEDEWINWDSPPASVDEYTTFLRTPGTWLTNYELQALVTMSPPSLKCFTSSISLNPRRYFHPSHKTRKPIQPIKPKLLLLVCRQIRRRRFICV